MDLNPSSSSLQTPSAPPVTGTPVHLAGGDRYQEERHPHVQLAMKFSQVCSQNLVPSPHYLLCYPRASTFLSALDGCVSLPPNWFYDLQFYLLSSSLHAGVKLFEHEPYMPRSCPRPSR